MSYSQLARPFYRRTLSSERALAANRRDSFLEILPKEVCCRLELIEVEMSEELHASRNIVENENTELFWLAPLSRSALKQRTVRLGLRPTEW